MEPEVLRHRPDLWVVALGRHRVRGQHFLGGRNVLGHGLFGQDMLAGVQSAGDHVGLREDGQDDHHSFDLLAGEQVVEALPGGGGFIVVDGYAGGVPGRAGEGLGGFLGAGVDGLEGQGGVGFDCGEVFWLMLVRGSSGAS